MNELDVYCLNKNHGCSEKFKYQKLDHHLSTDCPFQKINCPKNKACACILFRKDLPQHMEEECKLCDLCSKCEKLIDPTKTQHPKCLVNLKKEIEEAKNKLLEKRNQLEEAYDKQRELEKTINKIEERKVRQKAIEKYKEEKEKQQKELEKQKEMEKENEKVQPKSNEEEKIPAKVLLEKADMDEPEMYCYKCAKYLKASIYDSHYEKCGNPSKRNISKSEIVKEPKIRKVYDSKAKRLAAISAELASLKVAQSQNQVEEVKKAE